MTKPTEVWRRLKLLLQRDRVTRELEEEMRLHLELRAERIGPEAAQRRFGNATVVQQQSRDAWGFMRLHDLVSDLKFATRRIWKQRGVSATVIGVMGIGIGATTAMFSAVDAALLRPLPFEKPEQLMMLPFQVPDEIPERNPSKIDFVAVRGMSDLFSHVAAYAVGGLNLSDNDRPIRLKVGVVTVDFFATLGIRPAMGRMFAASEGVPNGPSVALLSDGLWKRAFGSRPLTGLTVTLNKKTYDVVGIMPSGFTFPEQSDIWIPLPVPYTRATLDAFRDIMQPTVVARVADNVTVRDAAVQLLTRIENAPGQRFPRHPQDNAPWIAERRSEGGVGTPLQKVLSADRSNALYVLLGATALLLLIACANVTNLLLAQSAARRREIAVRQILGATRTRIVRQLLTESVLLSLCGALVGLVIAVGAFQALRSLLPAGLSGLTDVHVDVRMLSFSTALAVTAGILFGLWPAVGSARDNASDAIKSGDGHGATANWGGRLRRTLVGAELALTVMLLIGAGIMLRSFEKIVNRDAGIQTANVGTMELAFSASTGIPERLRLLTEIVGKLASMPGVVAAGASRTLPLATSGRFFIGVTVPGATEAMDKQANEIGIIYEDATSGYFRALNIPLLEGRLFNASEDAAKSKSIIISETVAKLYWPETSPIGRVVYLSPRDTVTIIGVVSDVARKLDSKIPGQVYRPLGGNVPSVATIVARSVQPSTAVLKQMTDAMRAVDATQPVFSLRMMDDVRDLSIAPRRTSTKFLTIFAALALVLASVGVYAVVSYGLAQRQRELGIRSALGATGGNLLSLLSGEMVWVAGFGVSIGMFGAWAAARILERQAYGVDVHDPFTFVLVPVTLLAAAMLATIVPARRVFRVNPSDIMRVD